MGHRFKSSNKLMYLQPTRSDVEPPKSTKPDTTPVLEALMEFSRQALIEKEAQDSVRRAKYKKILDGLEVPKPGMPKLIKPPLGNIKNLGVGPNNWKSDAKSTFTMDKFSYITNERYQQPVKS